MSKPKTILLTSASGNIGKALVPLLLSQSPAPKLVLPTSDASKLKSAIPSLAQSNASIEEGSVKDPAWFQSLLTTHNVDTVFLCLTGTDELFISMNCVDAISRVPAVKKLIYLSISGDFTSEAGFIDTIRTRGYPHLFAKVLVEQRLKHATLPFAWTVLGPTLFFSNDINQNPRIRSNNQLDTPLFEPAVNKVSLSDIALAIRNAMYDTSGTWNGKKVMLGTKTTYTGHDIKDIWSRATGKPVQGFFGTEEGMEIFETEFRKIWSSDAGKALVRDIRLVFEFLMRDGISISDEEYEEQKKLLGKEPDDYEAWVKETVASWSKE